MPLPRSGAVRCRSINCRGGHPVARLGIHHPPRSRDWPRPRRFRPDGTCCAVPGTRNCQHEEAEAVEYRQLGGSGLKVPVLSVGTGTFGGGTEFFKAWGASDVVDATRLVDVCLEAGLTMFGSADIYSDGMAEEILGQAIKGRRDKVIVSTKDTFRTGPNDVGSSRHY